MATPDLDRLMADRRLTADGAPFETATSWLAPVRRDGAPAMLKLARGEDERGGSAALEWFGGEGAVRLLAADGPAQLLERACGSESLIDWVGAGRDDEASAVIATVLGKLHRPRAAALPDLTPLEIRLRALLASTEGGLLAEGRDEARRLLANAPAPQVLHGDIHHENIVHDTARGWLAIDPKGLWGERTYDYANSLANPIRHPQIVLAPGRLQRQAAILATIGELDLQRLLHWTFVHSVLAACWSREDGGDDRHWLAVAELARAAYR